MNTNFRKLTVKLADRDDREAVYRMRHEVYAKELGQHQANAQGRLSDPLDRVNDYIVVKEGDQVAGFVSVTPPNPVGYSMDKYFQRDQLPLVYDHGLYEVRLLTVPADRRSQSLGMLLMVAALRYVESRAGHTIAGIGRLEVMDLYRRCGLKGLGARVKSGDVEFEAMMAPVSALREEANRQSELLEHLQQRVDWKLEGIPFHPGESCYHGGEFFKAIGEEFDRPDRAQNIISADVLDAWFNPAPSVVGALERHLPFALKTSPPTGCEGLQRVLAAHRRVPVASVLPGAGSSDLIFLGLRQWIQPQSRVLILDPMYGEYAHVLEKVIGCRVDRLELKREKGYRVDAGELSAALARGYDWAVLVNPNSPTGRHLEGSILQSLIQAAPATRFWIDETYVEYAGENQSLESFAAASEHVVVCKSMSKMYALSGARCAYLVGPRPMMDELRKVSPPWAVSLPGQIAAVEALKAVDWYRRRWADTHRLRDELAGGLRDLGLEVVDSVGNFLLCHLPDEAPAAETVVKACRARGLYLRDVGNMGKSSLGPRALRVAVKDGRTNLAMLQILQMVLQDACRPSLAA